MPRRQLPPAVEINIFGPVTNSEIIGIKTAPSAPIRQVTDRLFSTVFFEFLGLPRLAELVIQLESIIAKRTGRLRVYDFDRAGLEYLWMSVLQDQYWMATPGTFMRGELNGEREEAITAPLDGGEHLQLKNVQLSPFVNRAPGKFYRGGWEFHMGHEDIDAGRFAVSESTWTYEDYAVRTMGLGDVRLGELDGHYLLQCGDRNIVPEGAAYWCAVGGAALSALGFPLVVDYSTYRRLAPLFAQYGSAFVETLDAKLCHASQDSCLLWAPGVPKLVLATPGPRSLKGIGKPQESTAAAWTIAADEKLQHCHYCTWGFALGSDGYQNSLQKAVGIINDAIAERGLRPLFEFDADVNWFGEATLFHPSDMARLSRQIQSDPAVRQRADLIAYSAQYDTFVARHTRPGASLETRDLISRGLAAIDLNDFRSAVAYLSEADRLLPADDFVEFRLGIAMRAAGDRHNAMLKLSSLAQRHPTTELGQHAQIVLTEIREESEHAD